mmetsp:Transcript_192/g.293  ORF Transcript_192/g.293 Transcript_192/m.293 type:complete len:627 (+) Transcript_192:161-2041(+)|eukprot:CAMPEP_0184860364 /NCGR_PEP_ID=MMETSP0580-20130426/5257_1 /TAXON_ID=1118495 /ORGANISM="Dactyliosolen fragilissimus" /LENGTH=626 /DNA_ID=CAMNT_0027357437 /DNA_START=106 /DNA_END=1986 /DNA_ORIENTATION=+
MSGNPSDGSSPASSSPVPQVPSPLVIGKTFIKQYYKVLTTTPDLIHRFYKPSSILSHSFEASVPIQPQKLGTGVGSFFQWASSSEDEKSGLRLDFGMGAIDAQETASGGILLVVTGRMVLPSMHTERAKPFVHTFVLNNSAPQGKKRQYYVHNDILRFVAADEDVQTEIIKTETETAPAQTSSVSHTPSPKTGTMPVVVEEGSTEDASDDAETKKIEKQGSETQAAPKTEDEKVDEDPAIGEKHGSKKKENLIAAVPQDIPIQAKTKTINDETQDQSKTSATNDSQSDQKEDKKSKKNKSRNNRGNRKDRSSSSRSPTPSEKADGNKPKGGKESANSQGGKGNSVSKSSSSGSSKPKVPGSWASLLFDGASAAAVAAANTAPSNKVSSSPSSKPSSDASTPASDDLVVEQNKEGADTEGAVEDKSSTMTSPSSQQNSKTEARKGVPTSSRSAQSQSSSQRTREATLFLKSISDRTKEVDIRGMFEPYATKLNRKILGITLNANRGFCFVDFDHREVVDTILGDVALCKGEDIDTHTFALYGRILEVGRKVHMDKGGSYRGRGQSQQHGGGGGGGRYRQHRSSSPGGAPYQKHGRKSPRGGNRAVGNSSGSAQGQQRNGSGASSNGK